MNLTKVGIFMLFNLNKCSYFELKLFSWQTRLFAFGHAFGKWHDFYVFRALF